MSTAVKTTKGDLRPLKVLVALIKQALRNAKEASDRAQVPYWEEIGTLLREAQQQMSNSELYSWANRNFKIRQTQVHVYLKYGKPLEISSGAAPRPTSLSDVIRASGGSPRGTERGGEAWKTDVSESVAKINFDRLRQEEQSQDVERKLEKELALKLIDLGFKILAAKLHPDVRGGSKDAMTRLNHVRARLRKVYT